MNDKHDSIGKSLHTNNPRWQIIVYNPSKSGVMVDISFEEAYEARMYFEKAISLGYPATLIELCPKKS